MQPARGLHNHCGQQKCIFSNDGVTREFWWWSSLPSLYMASHTTTYLWDLQNSWHLGSQQIPEGSQSCPYVWSPYAILAWLDVCVSICLSHWQDLAYLLQIFADHLLNWIKEVLGKSKLNARFITQHKWVGTRHSTKGIMHVNQMTGHKNWDIQCTIVALIAGVPPHLDLFMQSVPLLNSSILPKIWFILQKPCCQWHRPLQTFMHSNMLLSRLRQGGGRRVLRKTFSFPNSSSYKASEEQSRDWALWCSFWQIWWGACSSLTASVTN